MVESEYIDRDEFIRYITDEVNPARKKKGLSKIRKAEARECYRILLQFRQDWNTRADTGKEGEG